MSFSLKYLFAIVAVAAVFSAAFAFPSKWWPVATVMFTLLTLCAVTVGLSLRLLDRSFWLGFVIAGSLYFAIAMADISISRIPLYLPSTWIAYEIWWEWDIPNDGTLEVMLKGRTGNLFTVIQQERAFYFFLDTVHSLMTLLVAIVAGVIASYCVRRCTRRALDQTEE